MTTRHAPAIDCRALLSDPATSDWLRQALASALARDPLDVAVDAEIVAQVLRLRAEAALEAADHAGRP
jgi:hypothetical protein